MELFQTSITVIFLICVSAVCSGMNVALMSLDASDLKRRAALGNKKAQTVLPLRLNSHLSLASILLTNVAVISATSLVLDNVFSGLMAGILSTLLIVVFGEIVPQALFTKHALSVCARFAPILRFMIVVTYPISKPLQLILDRWFGHQTNRLHSRHELGIIISEHLNHSESELDEDEVEIVRNALQLSEKHVRDIMTPIETVYWLTPDTIIDGQKIDEIKEEGWSRIPVFNEDKTLSFGFVLVKNLVDMDFDEHPIAVRDLPLRPCKVVGSKTALDTLFRKFISAHTHLMPVERDDKIIGIVAIEDLIEEILGHEIEDEKD